MAAQPAQQPITVERGTVQAYAGAAMATDRPDAPAGGHAGHDPDRRRVRRRRRRSRAAPGMAPRRRPHRRQGPPLAAGFLPGGRATGPSGRRRQAALLWLSRGRRRARRSRWPRPSPFPRARLVWRSASASAGRGRTIWCSSSHRLGARRQGRDGISRIAAQQGDARGVEQDAASRSLGLPMNTSRTLTMTCHVARSSTPIGACRCVPRARRRASSAHDRR